MFSLFRGRALPLQIHVEVYESNEQCVNTHNADLVN